MSNFSLHLSTFKRSIRSALYWVMAGCQIKNSGWEFEYYLGLSSSAQSSTAGKFYSNSKELIRLLSGHPVDKRSFVVARMTHTK